MESAASTEYTYSPVNSDQGEIRLLTIRAGCETKPVECSLTHVLLRDTPQYEALSYVWGDHNDPSQILLEGCNFSVTSNLGTALAFLRLPHANRTMWIDAICIDQKNSAERASQVRLMGQIYQGAQQVVSWTIALESENTAQHAAYLLWEGRENDFSTAWARDVLRGDVQRRGKVYCITKLCSKSYEYWRRVWITQEVGFARKGVLKWKEIEIPYEDFRKFSTTFSAVLKDVKWMLEQFESSTFYLLQELSQDLSKSDIIRRIIPGTPLLDLLEQNRYKNATDPRDKLYRLLVLSDMASDSHERLRICHDNDWSTRDVYTGIVRTVVQKTARLDIVSNSQPYSNFLDLDYNQKNQEVNLPSWTPDWNAAPTKSFLSLRHSRTGAPGLIPASVEFSSDGNMMKARGICVGTVGIRGRCLPDYDNSGSHQNIALVREILHEWSRIHKNFAGDSADSLDTFS